MGFTALAANIKPNETGLRPCFLTTRSDADTWWTPTPQFGATDLVRLLPRLNYLTHALLNPMVS